MKWALPSTTKYPPKAHDTHLPQQPQASMPTQLWGGSNMFHPLPGHCCLSAGMAFRPGVAPTVSTPRKSPQHSLVPLQTFDCCFLFPSSQAALPTRLRPLAVPPLAGFDLPSVSLGLILLVCPSRLASHAPTLKVSSWTVL